MDILIAGLKGAAKSWTIWFNVIVGTVVAALPDALSSLPALKDYFPANVYGYAVVVLTVGNLLLRAKTSSALEHK